MGAESVLTPCYGRLLGPQRAGAPGEQSPRQLVPGPGPRDPGPPVGGGLRAVLWPSGWVGLAGGAACRLGAGQAGECCGGGGCLGRPPPRARLSSVALASPRLPAPRAPAQSREQQVKPARRQRAPSRARRPSLARRLCNSPPPLPTHSPPSIPVVLVPLVPPLSQPAKVCCHCDVTKGRPGGTFPP